MPSIKEFRQRSAKKYGEELYLTLLRKISIYLLPTLSKLKITPDQISFSWIALHIVSIVFFAFGKYEYIIAAILIKFIGDLLDTTDGAIARLSGKGGFKGVYLERIGHHITFPYMFVAIGFGVFLATKNIIYLLAGFVAAININLVEMVLLHREIIIVKKVPDWKEVVGTTEKKSLSLIHKLYRFFMEIHVALHSFIMFFFAIINRLDIFIIFAAVYTIPILLTRAGIDYTRNLGLKDKHYTYQNDRK